MNKFIIDFSNLLIYFIVCATFALIIRKFTRVPDELYRKLLHFILIGSAPVLLYMFSSWQNSVIASVIFAALIYPVLSFAQGWKGYSDLLAERDDGEIKRSLVLVFVMLAFVIYICWGILGARYLALAVILGWGLGDAAAALVGKRFGRRRLEGKFVDGKKTLEGSLAMFIVSFIAIITVLILNSSLPWHVYIPVALITAAVGSIVELNTKNGFDTITCPAATLAVMLPLVYLLGGMV
ncbi:MAG: phosphatidate cytidylyltransferase [Sedimentibacter sp.]|mgnify:CR=1 FL=1|nr:phosphatidate cytidylyltransferase [Sedimentibacter sp.]